ncbi:hypothetical protein [Legionella quinlivanii]|uniref:hypothetical protein n=1 Tax=Legionella quinlivanii TaxID=45073 RepID=UPI00224327B7|nr:hypothetical protein [Legionella quinlivanii]MCW8449833.1 hypothetical protein [Legionella quinlivanii]
MDTSRIATAHPQMMDLLFSHKDKTQRIFSDVLGLHQIHHMSIISIDSNARILIVSSTPSMEFNLFNRNLWEFDLTYNPAWYQRCEQASWQSLYHPARYEELYYLRQVRHELPVGTSIAEPAQEGGYFIYSLGSNNACMQVQSQFSHEKEFLSKIGQHCSSLLAPLFYGYKQ